MKVFITDALLINLDSERWECRRCGAELCSAREPYKYGLLVRAREPQEIHAPILDPARYTFTFCPDPAWVRLLEYCCPKCGRMIEVEYLPPGHPPAIDITFDLDALKSQWATRSSLDEPTIGREFSAPQPRADGHPAGHGH